MEHPFKYIYTLKYTQVSIVKVLINLLMHICFFIVVCENPHILILEGLGQKKLKSNTNEKPPKLERHGHSP